MTHARFLSVLRISICMLVVSIWFPGATQISGTDGSLSFLLALLCTVIGVAVYGKAAGNLHRNDALFMLGLLAVAGLIVLLALLSMLYADNPLRTLRVVFAQIFGFALLPTIAALAMGPRGPAEIDGIVSAFIGMGVVTACLVIAGLGDANFADRAAGYFKHANQLGIAMSAVLPLVAARLLLARRHRILLLGCTAAIVLGLVMSGSKTNFVVGTMGLLVFFTLYGVYLAARRRRPVALLAGLVAIPLTAQATLLTLQAFNPRAYRLLALQFSGGDAHSMVSREQLWAMSIELGLAHPFTGVGAGQPIGDIAPHSHNLFVEYFRTMGVPGAALIALMVFLVALYLAAAVLHTLFRGRERTETANVMLLGSAVSAWNYLLANQMSDSFGPSTAPFFWLPLALLVVYHGAQRSLRPATRAPLHASRLPRPVGAPIAGETPR
ncbi:O-antigen ligase [Nitratireductor sp. ZSWI3]|uniref:O-antigen ligase family protein n=1 Tax=Nitratireductor sp. ZSWI3 TaxID=2966359 RepID=UPI00215019A8|nr:O-antigen ligase family protein [Nitratireductor sp. ZSWI3]MCR4267849.1 O-antigen ligase family protein [Nitratireductor sp. ZSWI3]